MYFFFSIRQRDALCSQYSPDGVRPNTGISDLFGIIIVFRLEILPQTTTVHRDSECSTNGLKTMTSTVSTTATFDWLESK